jgi:indolepyruvate ferredoxin oxidoreductase
MVQWMDRHTDTHSQMGGEGVQWLGQAPFTSERHVFANLGDGTYFHSGSLAIRAAVAAGVNVTYKLLFNDAVAMTGGQPADGAVSVAQTTRQIAAEGVRRIAVVSDEPEKYGPDAGFAEGTTLHPRKALDALQRELRETPGCSVLIYDQTCAAELRRRRKRALAPARDRRVFINESVCEGCGDCSKQSNCVSIEPVETPFGRKRRVNQTSCNQDYSCMDGLCPSFVSVRGGRLRRSAGQSPAALAEPLAALPLPAPLLGDEPWNIVITGIGGTGVVTLGALVGMAAHLEGRAVAVLDQTGLAQKGGAVLSHVRIAGTSQLLHASRVPSRRADALLACDLIVAAGEQALPKLDRERTRSVVNTHVVPTGEFVLNNATRYDGSRYLERVHARSRELTALDATELATRLLGDGVGSNVLLLGYAFQQGLLPVSLEAIERAIELNGVAVEANLQAFRWGRVAAGAPHALPVAAGRGEATPREGLEQAIERRAAELCAYQNAALAGRYRAWVERVRAAEGRVVSGEALTDAVARAFFKLLAYKDEYEVARLYTDGAFLGWLSEQLEGEYRVEVQLAPPLFARIDPDTGRPRKTSFGPWMLRAMRWLARLKLLRGTPFDPFGYTEERRLERASIRRYEKLLERVLPQLTRANHATAVELAALPLEVRGFGAVKLEAARRAAERERLLLDRFLKSEQLADPWQQD